MIHDFLADVCVWKPKKIVQNPLNLTSFTTCLQSLERHFYLIAISDVSLEDSDACRLQLVEDHDGTLWLLKFPMGIWQTTHSDWRAFNLQTQEQEKWSQQKLTQQRKSYALLFELINEEEPLTEKILTDFVYKPIAMLQRPIVMLGLVSSMLQSWLFISLFYLVNDVVAYGLYSGFYNIIAFMAMAFICLGGITYMSARLQLWLTTEVHSRRHILAHTLIWKLNPALSAVQDNRANLNMADELCRIPEIKWTIKTLGVTCLITIPILILMFFRLPGTLFIGAILIMVPIIIWTLLQDNPPVGTHNPLALSAMGQLAYYGQSNSYIDHWNTQNRTTLEAQTAQAQEELDQHNRQQFYSGTSLILVMVFTALLLSTNAAQPVESSWIFSQIFLVTNFFNIMPRIISLVLQLRILKETRKRTQPLLDQINTHWQKERTLIPSQLNVRISKFALSNRDINLTLNANQTLGVRYYEEADRLYFVHCLLGLRKADSGSIQMGGQNTIDLSSQQRQQLISHASLFSTLIEGSLRDNLLLFATNTTNNQQLERRLNQVLCWLELEQTIGTLPLALNTPITQIDKSFSTGERQRLIMAQALMKPAQILIVDDALAGLEEQHELRILARVAQHYPIVIWCTLRDGMRSHVSSWIELSPPPTAEKSVTEASSHVFTRLHT